MMPFAERWGLLAAEILRGHAVLLGFTGDVELLAQLVEGSLAWKIACALQEAHNIDEAYIAQISRAEAIDCAGLIDEDCFKAEEIHAAIMARAKAHAEGTVS